MASRRGLAIAVPSRYPSGVAGRLFWGGLILLGVVLVGLGVAGGLMTYSILAARNDTETVSPASYLLSSVFYENLNFRDRAGREHEGWLLLGGLKGAPAIVLCHAYNSNRSELLSLGTLLRDNHFNVYLFNFEETKGRGKISDLGPSQAADLLKAIDVVTHHAAINPHRVGVYGVTTGGYAALVAAEQSPLIKALVVDTTYERPLEMYQTEIDRRLGRSSWGFYRLAEMEFRLFTLGSKPYPVGANLSKLGGMPKLFMKGRDLPSLADATEKLFQNAPPPKQLLVLEHSQSTLASTAERKEYENQVLAFFLQQLPLRAD